MNGQVPAARRRTEKLDAESFLIEGETIVLNEKGLSDFDALCSASEALPGTGDAVYHLAYEANLEGIV